MTSRETVELRGRTGEQLRADLESAHQSLFNLRFQAATRQLADVSQIAKAKKRIARAKTLLREHEILAEVDRASAAAAIPVTDEE
jgi:large subunit ribosomal protein L29